jgi:hypothetical protein
MDRDGLRSLDKALVFVAFLLWLVLFAGGVCIDSSPYRQAIAGAGPEINIFVAWFVVVAVYTPTNIALLSVFAGLLGALGAHARLFRRKREGQQEGPPPWLDQVNPFLSALLRGFFVYLAVISGILVLIENPFAAPTPDQYIRLAGFISVLSFIVSYDPRIFGKLVDWITDVIEAKAKQGSG